VPASPGRDGAICATGLREANITKLEWSQLDLERRVMWVHPDQAKGKKAIGIPRESERERAPQSLQACWAWGHLLAYVTAYLGILDGPGGRAPRQDPAAWRMGCCTGTARSSAKAKKKAAKPQGVAALDGLDGDRIGHGRLRVFLFRSPT